jgi:peptide/nickel transport system permease protein
MARLWRVVRRRFSYMAALGLLLMFALMAVFGPMLYPHGIPTSSHLYAPPSWKYPLGTDYAGGDVLAEIIVGARFVLFVAALAACLTMAIGVVIGLLSGYLGGIVDLVLMRLTDFILTIPTYPLLIVIAAVVKISGPIPMAVLLSINGWGGMARAVRSMVLSLKRRDFVEAARSLELGNRHIVLRQILPLIMPYVVMHLILAVTSAIYGEVGLFFLGLVPIQGTNWGVMLNFAYSASGAIYVPSSVFYLMAPVGAIVLVQIGSVTFTKALDEVFNPQISPS